MKKAPCARLGMRIRPKIREKPAESRNKRPPNEMLLRVWTIQNCIFCARRDLAPINSAVIPGRRLLAASPESITTDRDHGSRAPRFARPRDDCVPVTPSQSALATLRLEILALRPGLPVVHRALEELVRVVAPELAHAWIGLDHCVDELAALLLDLAVDLLERRLEHGRVGVGRRRIEAGIDLVVALHAGDELLVGGVVELGRVPAGRQAADRLVAHLLEQRLVDRRHAAEQRSLAAIFLVLAQELQPVRAREPEEQ